jgi:hypothetical protein
MGRVVRMESVSLPCATRTNGAPLRPHHLLQKILYEDCKLLRGLKLDRIALSEMLLARLRAPGDKVGGMRLSVPLQYIGPFARPLSDSEPVRAGDTRYAAGLRATCSLGCPLRPPLSIARPPGASH